MVPAPEPSLPAAKMIASGCWPVSEVSASRTARSMVADAEL